MCRLASAERVPAASVTPWLLLLFRHKLQVLIALYLYAVGYIIKPPGSLLECLGRLAGLEPLVMDWIGQTARDAVNGPVELV